MKNRIDVTWKRGGKELQLRATYNEQTDTWRIEIRQNRSDEFSYIDTTANVWRCFEELGSIYLP